MASGLSNGVLPTLAEEEESEDFSARSWQVPNSEDSKRASLSRHASAGLIRSVHSDVAYDNSEPDEHSDSIRSTEDPLIELRPPSRSDDASPMGAAAHGDGIESLSDSFQRSREIADPSDLEESSESGHSASRDDQHARRPPATSFGRSSVNAPVTPSPPPRRHNSENPHTVTTKPRLNVGLAERQGMIRQGSEASRASNGSTSSNSRSMTFGGSIRGSAGSNSGARASARNSNSNSISAALSRRSRALSRIVKSSADLNVGNHVEDGSAEDSQNPTSIYRGYKPGDPCLLGNLDWGSAPPGGGNWSSLVNKRGFPPNEGNTPEEKRGPYSYVFAIVKQVNYEEFVAHYTVTREDTGQHVRGDAENMVPLHDPDAIAAAQSAAQRFANGEDLGDEDGEDGDGNGNYRNQESKAKRCLENIVVTILFPFFCLFDCFVDNIGLRLIWWGKSAYRTLHEEFHHLLNGSGRYYCTVRLSITNFLVMCSIWYMFIDQARLAFFPAGSDFALAVANLIVWIILAIELLMEMFIRPSGYQSLIVSEKAFSPTTVRYICAFHLTTELIALGFFIPEFLCLFSGDQCDGRPSVSLINASLLAITGPTRMDVFCGRLYFACVRFRVFGCVRHWKNMWIRRIFLNNLIIRRNGSDADAGPVPYTGLPEDQETAIPVDVPDDLKIQKTPEESSLEQRKREVALINASNIGTALMVTNSYRSMTIFWAIVSLFPMISIIYQQSVADVMPKELTQQLQSINVLVNEVGDGGDSCEFFGESIGAWVDSLDQRNKPLITTDSEEFLFSMAIQPARCTDEISDALIDGFTVMNTACSGYQDIFDIADPSGDCLIITPMGNQSPDSLSNLEDMTDTANVRLGAIQLYSDDPVTMSFENESGIVADAPFYVAVNFNQTYSIETSALAALLLQICLLIAVISSLLLFRHDAENLVLGPLRNMLKIVARYAKNPLTTARQADKQSSDDDASQSSSDGAAADAYGSYETEQLITAVSKITDLLRKCWGVAGADIISTNLASQEGALTEVFNPTVPGQSVYALFAFATIGGFDHALKCLRGDVMILINNVAAVLHDEVFRWGLHESGQCNKNLGASFLMVFRIGLVKEVEQKLKEATNVIFSTKSSTKSSSKKSFGRKSSIDSKRSGTPSSHGGHHRNSSGFDGKVQRLAIAKTAAHHLKTNHQQKKRDAVALKSLPGISMFTDLAVIGMLKSFAGIHRDKKLRNWNDDFRLTSGVTKYNVNMIFGMDAGWAVEGAVGSEYKIDATYLSPHVNMAARMMSACKHYGVTILLSEAVQELMSGAAQAKLRNLDRVTVKGSTHIQKIFTYDARHTGASFFLHDTADDGSHNYKPTIWSTDPDLKAMRHHVTEDFEQEFSIGLQAYLDGNWPLAIDKLEKANEIMVEAAMEEGYLHDECDTDPERKEKYRSETSDRPSCYLVNYMKSRNGVAPGDWAGWHPLLSK